MSISCIYAGYTCVGDHCCIWIVMWRSRAVCSTRSRTLSPTRSRPRTPNNLIVTSWSRGFATLVLTPMRMSINPASHTNSSLPSFVLYHFHHSCPKLNERSRADCRMVSYSATPQYVMDVSETPQSNTSTIIPVELLETKKWVAYSRLFSLLQDSLARPERHRSICPPS